jgi:hypothetical protein
MSCLSCLFWPQKLQMCRQCILSLNFTPSTTPERKSGKENIYIYVFFLFGKERAKENSIYVIADFIYKFLTRTVLIQGTHAQLGRATYKGNTSWPPQYEGSVSEVWAYILKRRRHATVARNILTYELIQCGGSIK